jgi:general stress protein YciG
MSGNKTGGAKMRETMLNRFGTEEKWRAWMRENASKGGKLGGSVSSSNFKNNPDLASRAGAIGGRKSRRGKVVK